jgi:hypothetical protein
MAFQVRRRNRRGSNHHFRLASIRKHKADVTPLRIWAMNGHEHQFGSEEWGHDILLFALCGALVIADAPAAGPGSELQKHFSRTPKLHRL